MKCVQEHGSPVNVGHHQVALPLLRFLRSAHRWAVPGLGVCGPSSQFTAKINRSNTRVFGAAGLDQRRAGVLLHSKPYRPLPGQRCQLGQSFERYFRSLKLENAEFTLCSVVLNICM